MSNSSEVHGFLEIFWSEYGVYFISPQLICAILCNSFTFVVLLRDNCGFEEHSKLLCRALLLSDTFAIIILTVISILRIFSGVKVRSACAYGTILLGTTLVLSNLYMSLWSFDRLLKVWKPFLYIRYVTVKVVMLALLVTTTLRLIYFAVQVAALNRMNPIGRLDYCFVGNELKPTDAVFYSIVEIGVVDMVVKANIFLLIIALKKLKAERKLHPAVIPAAIATRNDQQTPEDEAPSPPQAPANDQMNYRLFKCIRTVLVVIVGSNVATIPRLIVASNSRFFGPNVAVDLAIACSTWWKGIIFVLTNRQFRDAARSEIDRIKTFLQH